MSLYAVQTFTLNVKPHPKERPRMTTTRWGAARTYTPEGTVAAEQEIRWLLTSRQPHRYPMPTPVKLDAVFAIIRPKSSERVFPISGNRAEADVDQYVKLLMDACSGVLWDDDNQVVEMVARKIFDDERQGIRFTVAIAALV